MRFILYGAGGVGGVIGAELHKAGTEVLLIARGKHLEILRDRGLRYETPFEDATLALPVVGHPEEIAFRADDVVLLTMKSQHTSAALDDLRAAGGDRLPVICCQNGVANERMALRRFRDVYAMLVYLPAQFIEPGRIQCHARLKCGVLDLGRYPSGSDDVAAEIARWLEEANLSARPDSQVMRFKHAKLLMNLSNGLDAVAPSGVAVDEIRSTLKAEGRACFAAAGIDWASSDEVQERLDGVFELGEIAGNERVGGSSRQSLLRGTGDVEADYLNGEIVVLGRLHGVPTPANSVIQRLANDMARRKGPPGSLSIDRVQALIAEEAEATGTLPT